MCSLITNKVKINLRLVSIKLFIICTILCATIYNLMYQTIMLLLAILLTQLFSALLTTQIFKPRLFCSHATQLHTRLTEFLPLVVCFVLPNSFEVECQCFRFPESSNTTSSLFVCFVHIACCCVRLVFSPFSY